MKNILLGLLVTTSLSIVADAKNAGKLPRDDLKDAFAKNK